MVIDVGSAQTSNVDDKSSLRTTQRQKAEGFGIIDGNLISLSKLSSLSSEENPHQHGIALHSRGLEDETFILFSYMQVKKVKVRL